MLLSIENAGIRAARRSAAIQLFAAAISLGYFFPAVALAQAGSPDLIHAGESLFRGTARFTHGGPACAACHNVSGLPFPAGGTMGPDLTHEYSKVGAVGLQGSLQTLFFPTMTPLFANRPLTTDEQSQLFAFLKNADSKTVAGTPTEIFAWVALIGCALLVIVTWLLGRKRIRSVRKAMLHRAVQKRGAVS